MSDKNAVIDHYDHIAADYTDRYSSALLQQTQRYPNNYIRLQIAMGVFARAGVTKLYDAGAGEGSPMIKLSSLGCQVWGSDISPEMVAAAKENLQKAGLNPDHMAVADVEDIVSMADHVAAGPFDGLICFGVLPHLSYDRLALRNMRNLMSKDGTALIGIRNQLFSLFTYNRHSHNFIVNELLAGFDPDLVDATSKALAERCEMSQPPIRQAPSGTNVSYDTISGLFHNPLTVGQLFEETGFRLKRIHFYHAHPMPPWLSGQDASKFIAEGVRFDLAGASDDWRRMFICSAGLCELTAI